MADQPPTQPPSRENQTRLIVSLVVAVLLLIFALQNRHKVSVEFLFLDIETRMIWVIILSGIAGAIAGWLVRRVRRQRRERRERRG
jgi:uncharacterized integral membrane protein